MEGYPSHGTLSASIQWKIIAFENLITLLPQTRNENQEWEKTDALKHNHYASALENSAKHERITWYLTVRGVWALCSV